MLSKSNKFKKITLLKHQIENVKKMLYIESNQHIFINNKNKCKNLKCISDAAILSDPIGSGKKIEILSLINKSNMDKQKKEITNIHFNNVIKREFKHILKPTLIFCNSYNLNNWIINIKYYTNFKLFIIENSKHIKKLYTYILTNNINKYDIILIKNGIIKNVIPLPFKNLCLEKKNITNYNYIFNYIANLRNYCWSRLIISDFDINKIPINSGAINSLFTWYIFSVKKSYKKIIDYNNHHNTESLLFNYNFNYNNIYNNKLLSNYYNIYNTNISIDYKIKFYYYNYKYLYDNIKYDFTIFENCGNFQNISYNSYLSEIINLMDIKIDNIKKIFEYILNDNYTNFIYFHYLLDFIIKTQNNFNNLKYNKIYEYSYIDLLEFKPLLYINDNIKKLFDINYSKFLVNYNKTLNNFYRIKNNIDQKYCPICYYLYDNIDNNLIILKCCHIILCYSCVIKIFNINFINGLYGNCPCCRTSINLKKIIFLSEKIILNDLYTFNINFEYNNYLDTQSNLIKLIYTILYSHIYEHKFSVNIDKIEIKLNLYRILKGNYIKFNNNIKPKILLYSKNVLEFKKLFNLYNIKYHYMDGTYKQRCKLIKLFQYDTINILLVNSYKKCLGLNLYFLSDIIFVIHNINNFSESFNQILGRAQRFNRTFSLKIHIISCFKYEYFLKSNI